MNPPRKKSITFPHSLTTIFLLGIFTGCATGEKVKRASEILPPRPLEEVRVVHAGEFTKSYKVIGIVNARAFNMHAALNECRREAGELGADAIIDFSPKDSDRLDTYTAKAIVWQ